MYRLTNAEYNEAEKKLKEIEQQKLRMNAQRLEVERAMNGYYQIKKKFLWSFRPSSDKAMKKWSDENRTLSSINDEFNSLVYDFATVLEKYIERVRKVKQNDKRSSSKRTKESRR